MLDDLGWFLELASKFFDQTVFNFDLGRDSALDLFFALFYTFT